MQISEMRRLIKESPNEFKPLVFGSDETKRINDKAYSDIEKETKKYDGGLAKASRPQGPTMGVNDNKGMSDLLVYNQSKPYQERVGAQMRGYVSKDAEDKHKDDEFGNADFDGNKEIQKAMADHAKGAKEGQDKASEIGLTGRELDKDKLRKLDDTMFEGKKTIKMLTFKRTKFISEGHVLASVPDEYKTEGNRFIMKDNEKTEYLVEWHSQEPKVTKKLNMNLVNEEKDRIKALWGYKSAENYTSTSSFRLHEDKEFESMIRKSRNLMKG